MRRKGATLGVDALIARIARRQHGVISTVQLIQAGLDSAGISRRVAAGRLHRIHRGVYAVGHAALSNEGKWRAAVLACGKGAVLSHRSAAALWRLLAPTDGPVHVTLPTRAGRKRREGLTIHRSGTLLTSQTTLRTSIPVTKPPRTLSDLMATVPAGEYRKALRQADYLGLPTADHEPDRTRSELERRFLALCRRHRIPKPEVGVRLGPFLVDFLWRQQRLAVETDGYAGHRGPSAFEDDRARDLELKLMGFDVVRFTYRQVTEDPAAVAAALQRLLKR